MSITTDCFFCKTQCKMTELPDRSYAQHYSCEYCGEYLFDELLTRVIDTNEKKFKIACILNERRLKGLSGIVLSDKTDMNDKILNYPQVSVGDIIDDFPQKALNVLNRTILNLSRLPERPFDIIDFDAALTGHRLQLFNPEPNACYAVLEELANQGLIRFNRTSHGPFCLTGKLWDIVERLQEEEVDNKNAFVAMWFDKSMDVYYEKGFKAAIEKAGYQAIRIDTQEFNNKICDEIIAEIKRCKFLISDFTGQRGGVYFEAGFAKGLGRPTVFTVKSDEVDKLHFDTRQYNHIVYDSPKDLCEKLYNRICATIA